MGGVVSKESDLTALFNLIKTDYLSKLKKLLESQIKRFCILGKFPIYFVAGKVQVGLLEDTLVEELAQRNVHFMRSFGISKTPEGLRFAYVSGIEEGVPQKKDLDEIKLTLDELKYVEEQFMKSSERDEDEGLIDVLFTWSWPQEIKREATNFNVPVSFRLGPFIWNLKPRYIFTPAHDGLQHFERAPYENVDMKSGEFFHSTRFIALANAEDAKNLKKKWIYALNLVPGKFVTPLSLAKRPDDCTANPFLPVASKHLDTVKPTTSSAPNYFFQVSDELGSKRKYEGNTSDPTSQQLKRPPPDYICKKCHGKDHFYRDCIYKDSKLEPKSTYVCHICHEPGHHIRNCPKKEEQGNDGSSRQQKAKSVAPDNCWFCLSNPAARKHLIIDIGEEVYLSLAKGPLTPEHLIIIPIEHVSATSQNLVIQDEIEQLMKRVNSLNAGKVAIFFRISSNSSHHYHIQSISIEASRIKDFIEFLEDFSIKLGYNFKPTSGETLNCSFFEFSYIDDSGKICRLTHTFDPSAFFPAQFGRQVLASFLEIEGGSDWKNQLYTEEDEKSFVSTLKIKLK